MKLCTARRPDGQPIIDFGSLSKITVDFEILMKARLHRSCSGVVMSLLMYIYLVSDIFTVIIKISNCSLHSSLGPTECQAQPRRHAAAIDADSEAHRREYPC
jgi:hypothetical protein